MIVPDAVRAADPQAPGDEFGWRAPEQASLASAEGSTESAVLFQHLYKTGGTTINHIFRNFLYERPLNDLLANRLNSANWESFYLTAHQYILNLQTPNSFSFTFIREPVSRLLSHRRQIMQASVADFGFMDPQMVAATLALQNAPLSTILDNYFYFPILIEALWNHQTLMLGAWPLILEMSRQDAPALQLHAHFTSGVEARDWLISNNTKIFERARQTLSSLNYIGIYEDFDSSVRELFDCLALPVPDVTPRLNRRQRYLDESDRELRGKAQPFIELDQELYEEACRLHGRRRRRSSRIADFLQRKIGQGEECHFDANAQPGGHGWYAPQVRPDGLASRWSGPGGRSSLCIQAPEGRLRIDLALFGAASADSILDMMMWVDDDIVSNTKEQLADGSWLVSATFDRSEAGPLQITLFVPVVNNDGFGVEMKSWRIQSLVKVQPEPAGDTPQPPDPAATFPSSRRRSSQKKAKSFRKEGDALLQNATDA